MTADSAQRERDRELAEIAALSADGHLEDVVRRLGALLAAQPDDARAILLLGRVMLARGAPQAALAQALEAAACAPASALPHVLASTACHLLDRWQDARRHAETAVALAPELPEAHLALARALQMRGRRSIARPDQHVGARAAALQAVSLAPADPQARFALGTVYATGGDPVGAQAAFLGVLDIDPEHPAAQEQLDRLAPGAEPRPRADRIRRWPRDARAVLAGLAALTADPAAPGETGDRVLRMLAWTVLLDALLASATRRAALPAARLAACLVLALLACAGLAGLWRLAPAVRTRLRRAVTRDPRRASAAAGLVLAAATVLAACLTAPGLAAALSVAGAAFGLLAYAAVAPPPGLWSAGPPSSRAPRPSSGLLSILAGALVILGASGLNAAPHDGVQSGAAPIAWVGLPAAAAVAVIVVRRRIRG